MEQPGDYERATPLYEECLQLMRELEELRGMAVALCNLGSVAEKQGSDEKAEGLFKERLRLYQRLSDKTGVAELFICMASVAAHHQHYERALRLVGAADALAKNIGVALDPDELRRTEVTSREAASALSAEACDAVWKEGAAMTVTEAAAFALGAEGAEVASGGQPSRANG